LRFSAIRPGARTDLDLRGSPDEVLARLPDAASSMPDAISSSEPRGRGRPRLGVVAREVTLLAAPLGMA